tara:strand:+ start:6369 stop:6572 length:204 start_codon:yes stop_codon:yes gene_type:complete
MLKLKSLFGFHLFVDKKEQTRYQKVWNGHKVHYTIVDALCCSLAPLTFQNRPTHGTLGLRQAWAQEK